MRISYLAPANSIHSHKWINYFIGCECDVQWISLARNTIGDIVVDDYYEYDGLVQALVKVAAIKKQIEVYRPDVLHVHSAGLYGLVGSIVGYVPTIITAWGSDVLYAEKSFIKGPLIRRALCKAHLVTCDALHMVEAIKKCGVAAERIRIINFGIDTDIFVRKTDAAYQERHGNNYKPKVIISLRNHEAVYDIPTLIRSVPLVIRRYPNVIFRVAGSGSQTAALEALVTRLGVSTNVCFVGSIPNKQLPVELSGADVYVSTSLSDGGIAASTAEAMACEVPVVVSSSGENSTWVRDGVTGMLFPPGDHVTLAAQIVRFLNNPQLSRNCASEARKSIVSRNSYCGEMNKMMHLYREVARANT